MHDVLCSSLCEQSRHSVQAALASALGDRQMLDGHSRQAHLVAHPGPSSLARPASEGWSLQNRLGQPSGVEAGGDRATGSAEPSRLRPTMEVERRVCHLWVWDCAC